ncbi:MAG TPA: ornithine cyclodeaminase family protein [Castellaniella sp.]|uniref:ornithine cyclodeaminase family protein n=1 Tax=Castellaniella sp. TaxID=1955812 RepID=UPI002F240416
MTIYLSDEAIACTLPLARAIDCVRMAFSDLASGQAQNAVRNRMASGSAVMNVMWASSQGSGAMAVKSYVTAGHGVTHGSALSLAIYSTETGELLALMEANILGRIRTAAATVIATRMMANANPATLSIYGTGFQAEYQVEALLSSVNTLTRVYVVGRNAEKRDAFVEKLSTGARDVEFLSADPRTAAASADIIVTATNSREPLFDATWLRPGVHINAVGSNAPEKAEISRATLERANLIVVDDLAVAQQECGDLIVNQWSMDRMNTLGELILGRAKTRTATDDITLFESQGLALQDLMCGLAVTKEAEKMGLGIKLTG